MKLAVFGRTGQVARELQARAPDHVSLDVIGRERADFSTPDQVADVARALQVDAIINAVAYTAVDKAEAERDLAQSVNATSVARLAEAAAETDTPLVHISTDYVFPGNGTTPWTPKDQTGPLGVYGATKLAGEDAIRASGARHVILRTSWVFSAHGGNFVKTMLRLGAERDRLTIVADQIGGPTHAAAIADACLATARALTDGHAGGTYNFSGAPDVSWAGFARAIFASAGLAPMVVDIPTSDYPTPAERPLNSRLDCSSLMRDFAIPRPDWKEGLAEVLDALTEQAE